MAYDPPLEFPEVIDSSLLSAYRSCPTKARRTYFQHWKPKGTGVHLHAGAAFAAGLEAARRAFYIEGRPSDDAIALGMAAIFSKYGFFDGGETNKTLDRVLGGLEAYFTEWPLGMDGTKPHDFGDGLHGIEFSFANPIPISHPITGNPLIFVGRADMICDYSGGVYIEDDKTASQLGASWGNQWRHRSQFAAYCWGAREAKIDVAGVLVRGLAFYKHGYGYAQELAFRPQWQIDRWFRNMLLLVESMKRDFYNGEWAYNLDHACTEFGTCEYIDICSVEESSEPTWMPMTFSRRRWDPVTRTETEL